MKTLQHAVVMVDLETLSTKVNATITEIGWAWAAFESTVDDDYNLQNNPRLAEGIRSERICLMPGTQARDVCPETVGWWQHSKHTEAARNYIASNHADQVDLWVGLVEFASFLSGLAMPYTIWGNGARFDLGILENAYQQIKRKNPWHYQDERCFRTIAALAGTHMRHFEPKVSHISSFDAEAELSALLDYCKEELVPYEIFNLLYSTSALRAMKKEKTS